MDAVDEEWEAFLGDLPDPSDHAFLSAFTEVPPINVQDESSPEFSRDDSVKGSVEASRNIITVGCSPIEDELSRYGESQSSESLKDTLILVPPGEREIPCQVLSEVFSLGGCQDLGSLGLTASKLSEIESFLMEGDDVKEVDRDDAKELLEEFLDALGDDPTSSSADPDAETVDKSLDSVEKEKRDDSSGKDEDVPDPLNKKRKRQLRNRDSALRSRERKKMYVKDLEAKSRFLEFECRRLEQVLALCYAENHALRIRLHTFEAHQNVVAAKQESAVLRMESLLLGSLLWLATVVWSVLFPSLGAGIEKAGAEEGNNVVSSVPSPPAKRMASDGQSRFVLFLRRRFKFSRKKMRADSLVDGLAGFTLTHCASSSLFVCFRNGLLF